MKPHFWIKRIGVYGHPTSPDSYIDFKEGLNVIYGPSNTGKSWVLNCIDYMFGASSSSLRVNESVGYAFVRMTISFESQDITLERSIGKGDSTVTIRSFHPDISSGNYSVNSSKRPSLSSFWLRLIGFPDSDSLRILKNKDYGLQTFTWRSFWHAFYAEENAISKSASILLPDTTTAQTSSKAALSTLITGKDFSEYKNHESQKVQKAKNAAILSYLEENAQQYEAALTEANALVDEYDSSVLDTTISELVTRSHHIRETMELLSSEGAELASNLAHVREQLTNDDVTLARYSELASIYRAKIERFEFISEGQSLIDTYPNALLCPVCDQPVPASLENERTVSISEERAEAYSRLEDLEHTIESIQSERHQLAENEASLLSRTQKISDSLSQDFAPQLDNLESLIHEYTSISRIISHRDELQASYDKSMEEISRRKTLTFVASSPSMESYFPENFWDEMSARLLDVLTELKFPHLSDAHMNKEKFDAIVNGQSKDGEGQGYRSLINTAVMLTFRSYLASKEAYSSPSVTLIDTPLLGLDNSQSDPESMKPIDVIPEAVYAFLISHQNEGQIIIADNTKFMPDISQLREKANFIYFDKEITGHGHHGFLVNIESNFSASHPQ
ncbi:ATP-binding protein [Alloscardovia macacae]|uniref:AAA domain-containing protein n=1 Tax=Alloscardovia macacae TaxID=1160091 RepID=A0A261F702_9BIFI|nr:ATP-binding protein [Alloscardovia macacae]OZG54858.1 AAA domain-containing protein [Alloscardovia macacae]